MTTYTGPFEEIPKFRYNLIMVDPPWQYENWSRLGEGKGAAKRLVLPS